jgi:hypothetical protein
VYPFRAQVNHQFDADERVSAVQNVAGNRKYAMPNYKASGAVRATTAGQCEGGPDAPHAAEELSLLVGNRCGMSNFRL